MIEPLLTPDEAIALARAAEAYATAHWLDPDADKALARMMRAAAHDARVLAVLVLGEAGDVRMLDALTELESRHESAYEERLRGLLAAVDTLLSRFEVPDCFLERLRASPWDAIQELAEDELSSRRSKPAPAVVKPPPPLPPPPPPWRAAFPEDPLAGRPDADALREPLARALALRAQHPPRTAPLLRALRRLPSALSIPVLVAFCARSDVAAAGHSPALARALIALDPSGAAAARACGNYTAAAFCLGIARRVAREGAVTRRGFCDAALGPGPRSSTDTFAAAIGLCWPPGEPCDALLASAGFPTAVTADAGGRYLWEAVVRAVLARPDVPLGSALEPALEAAEKWGYLSHELRERLLAAPEPRVRARAEAWLRGDAHLHALALRYFTGGGHEPGRDPPRAALFRRALADRTSRAVVLATPELRSVALPWLRAELRAGRTPASEVAQVVETIESLWGFAGASRGNEHQAERRRRALSGKLGRRSLRGPLTPEELERVRCARAVPGLSCRVGMELDVAVPPGTPPDPRDALHRERWTTAWRRTGTAEDDLRLAVLALDRWRPWMAAVLRELVEGKTLSPRADRDRAEDARDVARTALRHGEQDRIE